MANRKNESVFGVLFDINVSSYTEKKNGLSYLSWPYAWAQVKKIYPDAHYEVRLFGDNQLPYIYDEHTGYMVFTGVTISDMTHEMWLPVMDSSNKAMKSVSYTYDTKFKKGIVVEAATMFDINKTIMRCLVKNISMFGLGLYIYAGEDLPEAETEKISPQSAKSLKKFIEEFENSDRLYANILKNYSVKNFEDFTVHQHDEILAKLDKWQKRPDDFTAKK